jgi:hypothetical protein
MYSTLKLNLQATPEEDLRAAFDLLEGEGFYDRSSSDESMVGIRRAREALLERQKDYIDFWMQEGAYKDDTPEEQEEDKDHFNWRDSIGISIYGSGGWNRYMVQVDGTIGFSRMHGPGKAEDAGALGFEVC